MLEKAPFEATDGSGDIPGYVFMCSKDTRDECLKRMLLGLPREKLRSMEQCIVVGKTPLFLFDFSRKRVHGVFIAAAEPELNIIEEAWKGQGPPHSRRNPGRGLHPSTSQLNLSRL